MNSFFVPQLGSQIYTMAGMVTRLHLQADHAGSYPGLSANTAARVSPTCASRSTPSRPRRSRSGSTAARGAGPVLDAGTYAALARPSSAVAPFTYRSVAPDLFNGILGSAMHRMVPRGSPIRRHRGRKSESPGQAQLGRDPARSTDHHGGDGLHGPGDRGGPGLHHRQGILGPICGATGSPRSTTSASA